MERKMRRFRQQLTDAENEAVLRRGTHGVLALDGDDGTPYAVPVSYVYDNGRIFIHGASSGYKIDCIRKNPKVSFCVVDLDEIHPERFTTHFRSVIVFGKARIMEKEEIREALLKLALRYTPDDREGCEAETDGAVSRVAMIEILPDQITGKQAKELMRRQEENIK
jgi:nitroimidazol reductase NimA-like FMN-containing flavoprotein (pyridoxamine 5'-phosphate oxidase superfamily)